MTDLEKFKDLFDEIGIGYRFKDMMVYKRLEISKKSLDGNYGEAVNLIFNNDGKFDCFQGYGE